MKWATSEVLLEGLSGNISFFLLKGVFEKMCILHPVQNSFFFWGGGYSVYFFEASKSTCEKSSEMFHPKPLKNETKKQQLKIVFRIPFFLYC